MKIALFFALFLVIDLQLENVFATDLLIKAFSIESEYSDYLHYHLAKIVPAGPYQVIIWDQQVGHHDLLAASSSTSSSNRFCDGREIFHVPRQRGAADQRQYVFLADAMRNDDANANLNDAALAKCFVHFYTVKTDRKGRFLLRSDGKLADRSSIFNQQYNVHLIALNDNSQPIVDDVSYAASTKVVAQRVYVNDMRNSVDTICQHIDERCVINFYPTGYDREKQMKEMTKRWLTDQQHYQEMSEMVNFFLIAVFRELITSAKEKSALNVGTLTSNEAQLIGHFWNKFASTKKNGLLHKRLRLIDHQMVRLIDDFCKIDDSFLRSHHELKSALSASNQPEKFCENWPKVKETSNKYTNLDIVMEAFGHWLHTSEQLNNDEENIIFFWIEVFSKRLQSRCYNWPFLDQNLFKEIGMMFVTVKDEHKLTLDKIVRIKNINNMLDNICRKIFQISANEQFNPVPWKEQLCTGSYFQTVSPNDLRNKRKMSNEEENQTNTDTNAEDEQKICIICKEKERDNVALSPCGHQILCEDCLKNKLLIKCPYCRTKIKKPLRLYDAREY